MKEPTAYGHYRKKGDYIYRTSTYIQWGDSKQSIGACLLCNPGSAELEQEVLRKLHREGRAQGRIHELDDTMKQLVQVVEGIYEERKPLTGRLYIYNLFLIQNPVQGLALDLLEKLIEEGEYDPEESLVSVEEVAGHPWFLLGWGVAKKKSWKNYEQIKQSWRDRIQEARVLTFGKKHPKQNDYYHVCPRIPTERPGRIQELIQLHKELYPNKINLQRFLIHAIKPNLLVEKTALEEVETFRSYDFGWSKSTGNPEDIVKGFSHLRLKEGYKLRAYQYSEGGNGNGIVWAIPSDKELPETETCMVLEDYFLKPPKPTFALHDFMQCIEGDRTPLSYLQASIAYHELNEYGADWHGVSWGRDVILPCERGREQLNERTWEWKSEKPKIVEPHFYINGSGYPVVIFHTINDIGTVTYNRYVHTFSKEDYTLEFQHSCLATGGRGIIF